MLNTLKIGKEDNQNPTISQRSTDQEYKNFIKKPHMNFNRITQRRTIHTAVEHTEHYLKLQLAKSVDIEDQLDEQRTLEEQLLFPPQYL